MTASVLFTTRLVNAAMTYCDCRPRVITCLVILLRVGEYVGGSLQKCCLEQDIVLVLLRRIFIWLLGMYLVIYSHLSLSLFLVLIQPMLCVGGLVHFSRLYMFSDLPHITLACYLDQIVNPTGSRLSFAPMVCFGAPLLLQYHVDVPLFIVKLNKADFISKLSKKKNPEASIRYSCAFSNRP